MSQKITVHSLVVYKNAAAIVQQVGEKITIQLASGETVNVREKDIQWLHAGPLTRLSDLTMAPQGDLPAAWELLQGETVTLPELAEWVYGDRSSRSVWHAWLALQAQLYFKGSMDAIVAQSMDVVESIVQKQREKEQAAATWQAYLQRVKERAVEPADLEQLKEIERLAYGKASTNRTLKELGIEITPENAHKMLLQLGVWNEGVNPYPARFSCVTTQPELDVPGLPDDMREDFTSLETFAIDDENCNDPDDAISLDGDALWVHVADAAALVTPDSPLDVEARSRGANLYLPEILVNMLPAGVTSMLGLGLQEISPALSFKIGWDAEGAPTCLKMVLSRVKVHRISYAEAEQRMDESPFREMSAITERFRRRRIAQGAADITLPEVKIKTTTEGEPYNLADRQDLSVEKPQNFTVEITDLPRLKSRDMVTDAMLMAGEAIAQILIQHQIPAPFASQPPPDEPSTPETVAQMFAYRKKFKRSELHLDARCHSGLGLERYTRATSPLRRYSDLLVHQQIRAFLRGDAVLSESVMLERLAAAETGGNNTSLAERMSNRHWILNWMKQHPETIYQGIVVDKRDDRGTVLILELGIDVKMRRLAGYELDDEVNVQLLEVYLPELDLSCRIV